MGFAAGADATEAAKITTQEVLKRVEPEDLLSYGFIPEFIGRLPVVTVLDELSEQDLVRILTEPKSALVKQFAKLLSLDGVELVVTAEAIRELAGLAIKKGTGARALRAQLERLMRDVMFEVPTLESAATVTLTAAAVRGESAPLVCPKSVAEAA